MLKIDKKYSYGTFPHFQKIYMLYDLDDIETVLKSIPIITECGHFARKNAFSVTTLSCNVFPHKSMVGLIFEQINVNGMSASQPLVFNLPHSAMNITNKF